MAARALMMIGRNGATLTSPPAAMRLAVFVDVFPELSETFVLNEAKALAALGHELRIEAARRSGRPNPEAADAPPVVYWDEARRGGNLTALARLAARHPLRCARDFAQRLRWRRQEAVRPLRRLAPVARRVADSGDDHLHAHFAPGAA